MPVVGTLTVDLVANTASFSGDLGKAAQNAEQFGKSASEAGSRVDFSLREARGSMMLMSEELGVHIPRHLQALIAEIPGVGAAFAAMLPIVGVIAAIGIVEKLIEKNNEAKEAMVKGWEKSAETIARHNDELSVSIAKYEQLIAKLEGHPNNGVALTLAEARVEADKLSKSLETDIGELTKLMEKTARGGFMTALLGTSGSGQAADVAKGLSDAIGKVPHDSNFSRNMGQAITDAWQRAQSEINKNNSTDGGAFKNLTSSNEALQKLQEALSRYHETMDLIGQDDALRKHAAELQTASEAAKKAAAAEAEAFRESSRIMHEAMNIQKQDAIAAAKSQIEWSHIVEELDKTVARAKEKEAHEWLRMVERMDDEELKHSIVMAHLKVKADEDAAKLKFAMGQSTHRQALQAEIAAVQAETKIEVDGYNARIAALDKTNKEHLAKIREFENKRKEIEQQGAAQVKALQDREVEAVHSSEQRMRDEFAKTAAQSIVQGKNMLVAFEQVSAQMLQTTITRMLQQNAAEDAQQVKDAGHAAASAFKWVMQDVPFPFNAALAPVAAGAAFAGVMSFAKGGEVPGFGVGDTVPAMLTPGETVVTKQLTEQVKNSRSGRGDVHVHTTLNVVDSEHFEGLIKKHSNVISRAVHSELRRQNF